MEASEVFRTHPILVGVIKIDFWMGMSPLPWYFVLESGELILEIYVLLCLLASSFDKKVV